MHRDPGACFSLFWTCWLTWANHLIARPTSPTRKPEILSQILIEEGAVFKKVTGILMQKTLQWEIIYTTRSDKCTLLEFLISPKSQIILYIDNLSLKLKLKVSKITHRGNNYSAYGGDLTNKNNTVDKIPLKQRKRSVAKLVLYYFYSLHDRNILYHQLSNGDKKTELLQISSGYHSKIKHAWHFIINHHTPIHREVQTWIKIFPIYPWNPITNFFMIKDAAYGKKQ